MGRLLFYANECIYIFSTILLYQLFISLYILGSHLVTENKENHFKYS